MITQDEAWEEYNALANKVRAAIVHKVMVDMNLVNQQQFYFDQNKLIIYPTITGDNVIEGVTIELDEVKLLVKNTLGLEDELSLYSTEIHLIDLLETLQNLEAYVEIQNR